MIPADAVKLCREFCAENEAVLSSFSFDGNSVEHSAVRFIQRVAAGVQVPGSDELFAELHGEIKTGVTNGN